ncbi:MAG: hypothetical protein ABIR30_08725 [Chitinophagaceae bacterium]
MKRLVIALVFAAGVTAVAFASFNNSPKKADPEKKVEKKECKHTCPFS